MLRMRKAAMNWNVSVEILRARQAWSDRVIGPPRHMKIKPVLIPEVTAEWLISPHCASRCVILYVHGGAWTMGLHNLERRMLGRICRAAAVPALAVHYRLAPEWPFPAALEDCVAGYRWLVRSGTSPQHIVVTGISAGANLALGALMSLRDAGDSLPAAAVCISPIIDLACTGESFRRDEDPAVTAEFAFAMTQLYAGRHSLRLPLLSPCHGDLSGLPPLLVQVGGDEIVLSDAFRLQEQAHGAGVDVTLVVWPKMWHAWHLFAPFLPEAQRAVNGIGTFVREHLQPIHRLLATQRVPAPTRWS